MTRSKTMRATCIGVVGVVLCVPVLWGQSTAPRTTTATNDGALLAEVRALRADLAEASRSSLRVQMLVARVQLQEQRIIYFDRRRAEAATRTADAAEASRKATERVNELEERQRRFRSQNLQIPKQDAEALATQVGFELEKARSEAAAAVGAEQRARGEEAELASALAQETGRWSEFNARLDELERALPK
jgi:hypothetical protein